MARSGQVMRGFSSARIAVVVAVAVAVVALGSGGLACAVSPNERTLHEVDGQVVSSPPPSPAAYEAYLRARLALDRDPPQLEDAQRYIERAIRFDPREPHLWTTRAEIEERAGEPGKAAVSARRALAISPGYGPAEQVLARVQGQGAVGGASGGVSADADGPAPQP
ncbi:MAG: hypothetical protein AB1Z98_39390 [Nannocystaceae bacterium]